MSVALVVTATAGVSVGAVGIAPLDVWGIVGHRVAPGVFGPGDWTAAHEQIVWNLRLPRVLLGACVGGGLAVVGTALQALVRNPLADPYVFGITSGASVGATAVLIFGADGPGRRCRRRRSSVPSWRSASSWCSPAWAAGCRRRG